MPREDIDHAAFAADRERDFGRRDPFRQVAERPRNRFVKPRMSGIEQAIEVAGPPAAEHVDPDVQRGSDCAEAVERERPEMAAFEPGDRRLADAGAHAKVGLAPPAPNADKSDRAAEPLVAHPGSVASGSLLPITWPRIHPRTLRPGSRAHGGCRTDTPARVPPPDHGSGRIGPLNLA